MANRIAVHQMETKHKINWKEASATCIEFNVFEDERICFWKVGSRSATKIVLKFAAICQEHTLD